MRNVLIAILVIVGFINMLFALQVSIYILLAFFIIIMFQLVLNKRVYWLRTFSVFIVISILFIIWQFLGFNGWFFF